jgi:hypothetical protein
VSEEQFWTKPFPYGNSFGNLVLHVTGNLNHYFGAQLGNTGYVRDRDQEFAAGQTRGKGEVLRELDEAVEVVVKTLEAQTDETWQANYEAVGMSDVGNRFGAYLRCATHFHHHIGQMTYIVRAL